jgi:hypothetical protein
MTIFKYRNVIQSKVYRLGNWLIQFYYKGIIKEEGKKVSNYIRIGYNNNIVFTFLIKTKKEYFNSYNFFNFTNWKKNEKGEYLVDVFLKNKEED